MAILKNRVRNKTAALTVPYNFVFLARDSIYTIVRYMLSPVRPSVCPSRQTCGSVKDG